MAATFEAVAANGSTITWVDRKRRLWLLAFVVPTLPPVAVALVAWTGIEALAFWGVLFTFGLVPLADVLG